MKDPSITTHSLEEVRGFIGNNFGARPSESAGSRPEYKAGFASHNEAKNTPHKLIIDWWGVHISVLPDGGGWNAIEALIRRARCVPGGQLCNNGAG